jgi:hypothetical protein
MAKDYKQLKMEHVSGRTGSSLSDVNSVSLAMPVPYMAPRPHVLVELTADS